MAGGGGLVWLVEGGWYGWWSGAGMAGGAERA